MTDAAVATTRNDALGALPEWDLSDLYDGMQSPRLAEDLNAAEADAKAFASRYAGRLSSLGGTDLGQAVAAYERLQETLARVMSYAQLCHSGNVGDPETGQFFQSMRERVTDIGTHLLFFALELNGIDDAALEDKLSAPELARYRPWLRDIRAYRPHQLAEELEKLLHEKSVAGSGAWIRLFDETMARLRFTVCAAELSMAQLLNLFSDADGDKRRAAAVSLGGVLASNAHTFAFITNTLAKDKAVEDEWRHFARPTSARNLANFVEDDVVDALVAAVRQSYPRLSHRYYRLKAKWFGRDQLDQWDRNAPLPDAETDNVPWDQAVATVMDAYERFSPDMGSVARRFFDRSWIDAPARPGKASGAFAHPTVPGAHPYLLLNYQGSSRDVMTLAHELGHGVHQVLAADQGLLMADTPLTLADTASVFGEMLTFRKLLSEATEPRRRRALLAGKVEDMLNTVMRQIAFYEFERRVHERRRVGELLVDDLGAIWLEVQTESLGPAIRFDDNYKHYWSYVPHFVHAPFYVYAYAFGDCLGNSLYAVYEQAGEGFAAKYLDTLRAGGTLRHRELLAPYGLDATDPGFWQRGLGVIEAFVDELEALD